MRKIKFRAWDGKIMHEGVGVFEGRAFDFDGEASWLWHEPAEAIMQCTGLKDESNRDIYEGDIVSIDGGAYPYITKVFFEEGGFCVDIKGRSIELKYYVSMPFARIEVTGNIYENPEEKTI